jgi:hypothetical protein
MRMVVMHAQGQNGLVVVRKKDERKNVELCRAFNRLRTIEKLSCTAAQKAHHQIKFKF